jgi:hypothetical protein
VLDAEKFLASSERRRKTIEDAGLVKMEQQCSSPFYGSVRSRFLRTDIIYHRRPVSRPLRLDLRLDRGSARARNHQDDRQVRDVFANSQRLISFGKSHIWAMPNSPASPRKKGNSIDTNKKLQDACLPAVTPVLRLVDEALLRGRDVMRANTKAPKQ